MAWRPGVGLGPGASDVTGLRTERARRRRDGGPRRRAVSLAKWQRPGPRGQRPGAPPAHDRAPTICPTRRVASGSPARLRPEALLHELLALGYTPAAEVAGRGEFARRGGIVDVFPPSAPLPVRIEFFGDEIDSLRAFDPTDQRTVGPIDEASLLPASEFLTPHGGVAALRARLGRGSREAPRAPGRRPSPLRRRPRSRRTRPEHLTADPAPAPSADGITARALLVGDAAEVWAAHLAPSTGFDHLDASTLLVLDEPGDIAEAADFLWRQADERRDRARRGR